MENITNWALRLFETSYGKSGLLDPKRVHGKDKVQPGGAATSEGKRAVVSKQSIFYYVYAVLYDPVYRETYALNLRKEFPRIPFYNNFWQWAGWGRELFDLHVGFNAVEPWPLNRVDIKSKDGTPAGQPKVVLTADRKTGTIKLDSQTSLQGVPDAAWDYKLGNRSALEWVLDQHKERKPKDPIIQAAFDTYRFSRFKEDVVTLLGKVVRVSMETARITAKMANVPR